MRKGISFLLVLALVFASFAAVFAADSQTPADVKDTEYEAAVTALIEKGIISGYTDGTFRPDGTITRAEACVVVVKAMAPAKMHWKLCRRAVSPIWRALTGQRNTSIMLRRKALFPGIPMAPSARPTK